MNAYARSLAFHRWLAGALTVSPSEVGGEIDLLFRQVTRDLASSAVARVGARARVATKQRKPYEHLGMPEPGDDPGLEAIITETLAPYILTEPSPAALQTLTEKIKAYVAQENKRKNLVGEGFEDTLAAVLRRITSVSANFEVRVRPKLEELPGFNPPRGSEKGKVVDLALVDRSSGHRTLVTCKWSVRSDREEQFGNDFRAYSGLESLGEDFDYVLATNEFDPARLAASCEARRENAYLFSDIVHVNFDGPRAAYLGSGVKSDSRGIPRALSHNDAGRLKSLQQWLSNLSSGK